MLEGTERLPVVEARLDKERLQGAINEIAGRAKRQVGEWTGDRTAQVEGLAQEMKGKAQQAWCGVKDALRAIQEESSSARGKISTTDRDAEFRAAFRNRPQ